VLDDWRTAPIDERLRAALGYIEKLTRSPEEVGPEDADLTRRAGVSDAALTDAVYVCALFNTMDRVADALGFAVPTAAEFEKAAPLLLKVGYRLPL
jgi:alkylhydroperoxidase family enzyme